MKRASIEFSTRFIILLILMILIAATIIILATGYGSSLKTAFSNLFSSSESYAPLQ